MTARILLLCPRWPGSQVTWLLQGPEPHRPARPGPWGRGQHTGHPGRAGFAGTEGTPREQGAGTHVRDRMAHSLLGTEAPRGLLAGAWELLRCSGSGDGGVPSEQWRQERSARSTAQAPGGTGSPSSGQFKQLDLFHGQDLGEGFKGLMGVGLGPRGTTSLGGSPQPRPGAASARSLPSSGLAQGAPHLTVAVGAVGGGGERLVYRSLLGAGQGRAFLARKSYQL